MNNEKMFFHTLRSITMSGAKKTRLRGALSLYADERPMAVVEDAPTFLSILMESKRFPLYATLTALLVLGSGATTLAAEGSTPGDTFYAIKIHVNEPLMVVLSPSIEGKARVSATLATRRVDEVVLLASSGRLTAEKQEYLEAQFAYEAEKTREHTDELVSRGDKVTADEVRADFIVRLAGEAQALGAIQTPTPEKTKKFLSTVLAVSEANQGQEAENFLLADQLDGEAKEYVSQSVTLVATATEQKASSSASMRKNARSKGKTFTQVRTLRITASTTLQRIFENSTPAVAPKTDKAIQTIEQESQARVNTELRIDR